MKSFFSSLPLLALAACSVAPSESAIQTAIAQTAVVKETAQVTSGVLPIARVSATETPEQAAHGNTNFTVNDLPRMFLKPEDIPWLVKEDLGGHISARIAEEIQQMLGNCISKETMQACAPQVMESRRLVGDKGYVAEVIILCKDSMGSSGIAQPIAKSIRAATTISLIDVSAAGLGEEAYGLAIGEEGQTKNYIYVWQTRNAVLMLNARSEGMGEPDIRIIAVKMQAYTK